MNKKLVLLLTVILLSPISGFSQKNELTKEIDDQIWKPFMKSYSEYDVVKFNNLHADGIMRVTGGTIRLGEDYTQTIAQYWPGQKEQGVKQNIEFVFEERNSGTDVAYEVGYYKISLTQPGQDKREFVGYFHVVLKKIEGNWKIAQDWDTNKVNGVSLSAKDFTDARDRSLFK